MDMGAVWREEIERNLNLIKDKNDLRVTNVYSGEDLVEMLCW